MYSASALEFQPIGWPILCDDEGANGAGCCTAKSPPILAKKPARREVKHARQRPITDCARELRFGGLRSLTAVPSVGWIKESPTSNFAVMNHMRCLAHQTRVAQPTSTHCTSRLILTGSISARPPPTTFSWVRSTWRLASEGDGSR